MLAIYHCGIGRLLSSLLPEPPRAWSIAPISFLSPLLFVWDGRRYRFVSDMIGAGVIGHWVAPGERNVPDPTDPCRLLEPNGRGLYLINHIMDEVRFNDAGNQLVMVKRIPRREAPDSADKNI